jgi:hypothetical protein
MGSTMPGASTSSLLDFERRYGLGLPHALHQFYREMNGTPDYTSVEMGWMRIWPVEEIAPVHEFVADAEARRLPGFFVIADHGVSSWFFAVPLGGSTMDPVPVFRVGTGDPEEVAVSFVEFLKGLVEGSALV